MGFIGYTEVFLILIVAIVLFGSKRLPELGKMLGKGIREFRNATRDLTESLEYDNIDQPKKNKNDNNKSH